MQLIAVSVKKNAQNKSIIVHFSAYLLVNADLRYLGKA